MAYKFYLLFRDGGESAHVSWFDRIIDIVETGLVQGLNVHTEQDS